MLWFLWFLNGFLQFLIFLQTDFTLGKSRVQYGYRRCRFTHGQLSVVRQFLFFRKISRIDVYQSFPGPRAREWSCNNASRADIIAAIMTITAAIVAPEGEPSVNNVMGTTNRAITPITMCTLRVQRNALDKTDPTASANADSAKYDTIKSTITVKTGPNPVY